MERNKPVAERKQVEIPSGRISYIEQGRGPVALFVAWRPPQWPPLASPTGRTVGHAVLFRRGFARPR
jgi:hypothetical protein